LIEPTTSVGLKFGLDPLRRRIPGFVGKLLKLFRWPVRQLTPSRLPKADGLKYAAPIMEKDWMFINKIPNNAKPRRTSRDLIRSSLRVGRSFAVGAEAETTIDLL
jgi:hypothetical protein